MSFVITPKVDTAQEFIEIANDFSNPLDLVREAISNASDAKATEIKLGFSVVDDCGESLLKIEIEDNGSGMDEAGLQSFFDLGNSLRRKDKNVTGAIGEKGHGTKVYFNSKKVEVFTVKDSQKLHAVMEDPKRKLYDNDIPTVAVYNEKVSELPNGTRIIIYGYNANRRDKFTHAQLKDYILWFTKYGSVEVGLGIKKNLECILRLKGVDKTEYETIPFGHVFPAENSNVNKLFEEYEVDAPKWYCKKIVKIQNLKNFPEIQFQALFYVEGTKVKYSYNPMLRRSGYSSPDGAYTVQDRYGVWLCKDYIPVQRKNEWITVKGNEYTRFHAFVNCQALRLTANRGSVDNTPTEILQDLKDAIKSIYDDIVDSDDWSNLDWLESETEAYNTAKNEKSSFERRINKANLARIADYTDPNTGRTVHLVEPKQENGVFSIFMQLSSLDEKIFPFYVVDYDTHMGIDVIVKADDKMPIKTSRLYYVEFKNYLTKVFNHTFENLHSIVCWDINTNELKHGEEISDIANKKRVLKIVPPENSEDYTRYYLDADRDDRKIEVYVLKDYLREKLRINFAARTDSSIL